MSILLALVCIFLALVIAEEEFSIEKLNGYHSKDEVEQEVHDENVEHILEGVDDAIEDGLQLGNSFDGLERPEDAKHSKRLHRAQVFSAGTSPGISKVFFSVRDFPASFVIYFDLFKQIRPFPTSFFFLFIFSI